MKRTALSWLLCVFAVVMVAILAAGCSSSSSGTDNGTSGAATSGGTPTGTSGGPSGGTTYKGTFAGKGEGGSIDVNVSSSSTTSKDLHILTLFQVTGTLRITGGATSGITGTFDDASKTLTITGGGYSFTGTLGANGITGTYTGPNGSGSFSVLAGAASKAFCGTYAGMAMGVWNFTVNGTTLVGSYADAKGSGGGLTGTVDAAGKVTIQAENGGVANGTITGDTATGTYPGGTWTGAACGG